MSGVIYRRQSLDADNDELGITRQLKVCQRVAKSKGIPVSRVITDNSTSASKHGREGYGQLTQLMASGAITHVVILRIDRLLRLNDELEEMIQLVENYPVTVITAEGDIDLSTPQGRLMARILVSVARAEMEVKSARHKLANQQKAELGLPHGARRAYGYDKTGLKLKKREAVVLREVGQKFLHGWSYRELAKWLNDNGHKTAQGCQFFPITVANMLTRKRYAGIREYGGVDYRAVWPPVFDADTWLRIQHLVRQRKEDAGNRTVARKYLLTGLLTCGVCDTRLNGEMKRDNPSRPLRRTYQCRQCFGVCRGADPLEHFLRELAIARLDSPELMALLANDKESQDISRLTAERETTRLRLEGLLDDYSDGTLTKPEYTRAKQRQQNRLAELDRQLDAFYRSGQLGEAMTAGKTVRATWDEQTDGWRRQLLAMLIERVVVMPGSSKPFYRVEDKTYRFDPSLIDIDWRA